MRTNRNRIRIRNWAVGLVLVASVGAPAWGQDDAPPPPRPSAEAYERIDDIDEEIEAYIDRWREEMQKQAEEARKKAEESGGAMPAMSMRPDFSPFVEKLLRWADEAEGEDQALYLAKIVEIDGDLSEGTKSREAFDRLWKEHPRSYAWSRLGRYLPMYAYTLGEEAHRQLLETLANSPHADVRGWVVLARVADTIESADLDSKAYRDAKAALLAAAEEASDPDLIDELKGPIDLREKLGVGATAPDIVGVDLDGTPFKLSDYRGKIIMLDFWGDW